MTIRLLLADDHPVVLRGLADLLAAEPDCVVAGTAGDGAELQRLVRAVEWDVLVLDLQMPGASGVDLVRTLTGWFPKRAVLVCSLSPEEQYALRALRAGAAGYITKAAQPRELLAAIRQVARGGTYTSPAMAERLADNLRHPVTDPVARLSDRELEVLRGLARGLSVSELAMQLALSPKTVSTYRARLLDKLDLRHNAELTRFAIEHGLD